MQKGIPLPNNFGVQDRTFRMPGPVEFPKMAYKKDASHAEGYVTKIVKDQDEQDALGKGWLTDPKDVHALLESLRNPVEEEVEEKKEKKPKAKKSEE